MSYPALRRGSLLLLMTVSCLAPLLASPGHSAPSRAAARAAAGLGTVACWGGNAFGQTTAPAGLASAIQIGAGEFHSIALRADGTVVAWGANSLGQRNVPPDLSGVVQVAAGGFHNLALRVDGTIVPWGTSAFGLASIPPGAVPARQVAAGGNHSLALTTGGTVVAWGNNGSGQCIVPGTLASVLQIAGGGAHSLALKADGTVAAWGGNGLGQATVPSGLVNVIRIAAGESHSLALRADGTVAAWGDNGSGQCSVPSGLSGVIDIAAGDDYSLALKADGTVVPWGGSGSGQLTLPAGLANVTAIAAGGAHGLALRCGSAARFWGTDAGDVAPAAAAPGVKQVAGEYQFLALRADGTVVAWGENFYDTRNVPAGLSGVVQVAAGYYFSAALLADGTVVAWGDDTWGEVSGAASLTGIRQIAIYENQGLALRANGTVVGWGLGPAVPGGLANVIQVAAGAAHGLALRADGTVAGWGGFSSTGEGVPPAGLSRVTQVSAGSLRSLAVRAPGVLVYWGDDWAAPPGPFSGIKSTASGFSHDLVLRADGTVAGWGDNSFGALEVPSTLGPVSQVAPANHRSLAVGTPDLPPFFPALANATTREELPVTVRCGASDDSPESRLTFTATCSDPALVLPDGFAFSGLAANRSLRITPAPDQNGTATVTVSVSDGERSSVRAFQLTVTPVNDPPAFSLSPLHTVREGALLQTLPGWATGLSAGPPDESAQALLFQVSNDNPTLFQVQPALSTGGTLTYRPAAGAVGSAEVTVRLKDNGGTADGGQDTSAPQTFRITVNLAAPSSLTATALFGRQVRLAWQDNSRAENGCQIQRSREADFSTVEANLFAPANSRTYVDSGLAPAATYYYRMRAFNFPASLSAWSASATAATATPPGTPASLTATVASGPRVQLRWADVAGETGYQVERRPGGPAAPGAFTRLASLRAGVTAYADAAVTPGQAYTYRVLAFNAGDLSGPSPTASVTVPLPPAAPGNVAAQALSGTLVKVTWTAPAGSITAYRIERRDPGSAAFAPVGQVSGGTLFFNNGGLTAGATYTYAVRAVGPGGVSAAAGAAPVTTLTCQASPTGLVLQALSRTQVKATWQYAGSDSARVGFVLERRLATETQFVAVRTLGPGTRSTVDSTVSPGTSYCYRVRAGGGTGTANPLSALGVVATPGP